MQVPYVLCIIEFIVILLLIYIQNRIQQTAKNDADILQNRLKEYEAEKGRNLATKEDIGEVTKLLEEVKNTTALTIRKQFKTKKNQEELLIEMLRIASKVLVADRRLHIYLFDENSRARLDKYVEDVIEYMIEAYNTYNLAIASIEEEKINAQLKQLITALFHLGGELSTLAAEGANNIERMTFVWKHYEDSKYDDKESQMWFDKYSYYLSKQNDYKEKKLKYSDDLYNAVTAFQQMLKELYNRDFFSIIQS